MISATAGTLLKGWGDFIANIFDGVINRDDLDIPGAVKAPEKSLQQVIVIPRAFLSSPGVIRRLSNFSVVPQCKEMYNHAILRLRGELSYHEKERKKVTSKLQDSEARSARGDKKLGELRAALETTLREKANLAAQVFCLAHIRPFTSCSHTFHIRIFIGLPFFHRSRRVARGLIS